MRVSRVKSDKHNRAIVGAPHMSEAMLRRLARAFRRSPRSATRVAGRGSAGLISKSPRVGRLTTKVTTEAARRRRPRRRPEQRAVVVPRGWGRRRFPLRRLHPHRVAERPQCGVDRRHLQRARVGLLRQCPAQRDRPRRDPGHHRLALTAGGDRCRVGSTRPAPDPQAAPREEIAQHSLRICPIRRSSRPDSGASPPAQVPLSRRQDRRDVLGCLAGSRNPVSVLREVLCQQASRYRSRARASKSAARIVGRELLALAAPSVLYPFGSGARRNALPAARSSVAWCRATRLPPRARARRAHRPGLPQPALLERLGGACSRARTPRPAAGLSRMRQCGPSRNELSSEPHAPSRPWVRSNQGSDPRGRTRSIRGPRVRPNHHPRDRRLVTSVCAESSDGIDARRVDRQPESRNGACSVHSAASASRKDEPRRHRQVARAHDSVVSER